jgi:hypothetical protein
MSTALTTTTSLNDMELGNVLARSIAPGLCQCGCGGETTVAVKTDKRSGAIKGQPRRFLFGHNGNGDTHRAWKGGRSKSSRGYVRLKLPSHPRASADGYVLEHVVVAEAALGRPLPSQAVVHHINGDKTDNRPSNLIICEDHAYHMLLHRRQRAFAECGNANWHRCLICKEYDAPENLYIEPNESRAKHRECARQLWHVRKATRRNKVIR